MPYNREPLVFLVICHLADLGSGAGLEGDTRQTSGPYTNGSTGETTFLMLQTSPWVEQFSSPHMNEFFSPRIEGSLLSLHGEVL